MGGVAAGNEAEPAKSARANGSKSEKRERDGMGKPGCETESARSARGEENYADRLAPAGAQRLAWVNAQAVVRGPGVEPSVARCRAARASEPKKTPPRDRSSHD